MDSSIREAQTSRVARFAEIDLYPVISSEFTDGRDSVEVLKAVADGGARIVQLREKSLAKRAVYSLACDYREITDRYGMLLIINDHVDIALAVGADGVHLGQDDLPVRAARKIAPQLLIGLSTHSREEVEEAVELRPDYVNLGPIYATATKDHELSVNGIGPAVIGELSPLLPFPFTVMGGIKERHLPELIAAGATKIAMVTEITRAENITAKVRELRSCFI